MKLLNLSKIYPDPNQPRQKFIKKKLAELEESIKQNGILVPLYIESNYLGDNYLILDGERRYRCAKKLKIENVPVTITKGPLSFEKRTILRFHIQEQHKNWTLFDKARAISQLKKSTKLSIVDLAKKLNTSTPRVHNWLSITELTEENQMKILEEKISFSFLIHLIKVTKDYLSFSDLTQKEIEKKLINKIKLKIFKSTLEFQKFSRLMSTYEHYPEKLAFLNNEKMSLDEILEITKLNKNIILEDFEKNLVSFNKKLSKLINKKYSLSEEHKEVLKEIRNKINMFIK